MLQRHHARTATFVTRSLGDPGGAEIDAIAVQRDSLAAQPVELLPKISVPPCPDPWMNGFWVVAPLGASLAAFLADPEISALRGSTRPNTFGATAPSVSAPETFLSLGVEYDMVRVLP
jgi:hypothetical protein